MTSNEAPRSLEAQAAPYDLEAQSATEVLHVSLPLSLLIGDAPVVVW